MVGMKFIGTAGLRFLTPPFGNGELYPKSRYFRVMSKICKSYVKKKLCLNMDPKKQTLSPDQSYVQMCVRLKSTKVKSNRDFWK